MTMTLNVSAEQIEHDLRAGKSVDDIVTEWQEPRSNVLGVLRAMQAKGNAPTAPQPSARPVIPPRPSTIDPVDPRSITVDALVNAAARSASKRTQALGVRLADLAKVLRTRLADEREQAEAVEAQRRQREKALAEIRRLEAELANARAKVGAKRRGGHGTVPSSAETAALTCAKGCGKPFSRPSWKAKHEATCAGAS